jgi:outer membrane protein TolC
MRQPFPPALAGSLALAVASCASYRPAPLPAAPALTASAAAAPADLWTASDVVTMALRDSPDLRAARAQRAVAEAGRRQAGLPPDPSIGGAVLPLVAGLGSTLAWNAALGEDVRGLVTLSARRDGARAVELQVDAEILWQEWRTAAEARLLFVQIVEGDRMLALQRQSAALFADRNRRLQAALARGDASLATTAPELAALQTVRAQVDVSRRTQLARRHQLNALLGREPNGPLPLAGSAAVAEPDLARIDQLASEISLRRPDLVALRLGYRAQEARTRLAVLMQFPLFNLGVAGGSDNSNVRNLGPQISASLPVFDGNRGDVAVQRATRIQLRAEYQARLDGAYGQLRAAVSELKADEAALAAVTADLPGARRVEAQGRRALDAGAIDELAYADLAGGAVAKASEAASLEEAVFEQRLVIDAISGEGLPAIENLPDFAG